MLKLLTSELQHFAAKCTVKFVAYSLYIRDTTITVNIISTYLKTEYYSK
jgi:hypothetical protein